MERTYASIKNAWRLLLACALCLPLLGKAQTIIHVPGDYSTISAAITAASVGDIIEVGAGFYNETLTINKALTLKGAQVGVDPRPSVTSSRMIGGANETIVQMPKGSVLVNMNANDVTIDGFQFRQTGTSGLANGIMNTTGFTGNTFRNNIVTSISNGGMHLYGGTGFTIEQNYLSDISGSGIVIRNGNQFSATVQKIRNNDIVDVRTTTGGAIYTYGETDLEITGNVIRAKYQGIAIGAGGPSYYFMEGINVHHNTLEVEMATVGSIAYGITVNGLGNNIQIRNNRITSTGTNIGPKYELIKIGYDADATAVTNPQNLVISNNYFERPAGVNERYLTIGSNITNVVDASCNWWGTTTGSTVDNLVVGAAQVHTPFLMGGTDNDGGATGFIPSATCGSGIVHNTTQDKYYETLDAGINDSDPNDNIEIATGTTSISTWTNVNHPLTIKGAGIASTTVELNPTWFNTNGPNALQLNADNISIEDIHFKVTDATGQGNILGLFASNLLIKNNKFSGAYTDGVGEVTRATAWVASITGITFENNIIDALRQPGYINGGSGTIKNNSISNTRGWVIAGAGNLAITNNVFGTNATHIAIIPGAGNLTGLSIHDNNFSGTATPAIHNQDAGNGTVDVSCNWWGTTVANEIASRLGGPGAVTYAPYFVSGAEELGQEATLGFQPIVPNTCTGTPVTITASYLPITCYGGTTNVTLTVANGLPNYVMDPNNPPVAGVGASDSSYTYTVTDALGSHASVTITISEPAALSGVVNTTNPNCYQTATGSITISSSLGGSLDFEYSIDDGATWQASNTFTGLGEGTYQVRMRDKQAPTCWKDLDGAGGTFLNDPDELSATATATIADCFGAATGSILINAPQGGSGNYEYSRDGSNWHAGPAYTFTSLLAGNYTVQVRDAAAPACLVSLPSTTVGEQPQMNATLASTNVTCNGANNGTITVSAPGGGSGSTYNVSIDGGSWVTNPTFPYTFNGLAPGAHTVAIQDGSVLSCTRTVGSITITEPAVLVAGATPTAILCYGGSSSVTLTITGGTSPYQVSVNGGGFAALTSPYSLPAGTHTFAIEDANGCTTSTNTTIGQPSAITFTATAPRIACHNGTTNVTLTITGGTAPISFSGLNPPVFNRPGGSYTYNATDANGCPATTSITIENPGTLMASRTTTDVTCNAVDDGTITISAPGGGWLNYQYSIDGGSTWLPASGDNTFSGHTFTGLAPATYTVQMRDKDTPRCTVTLGSHTIAEPGALSATVTTSEATCSNTNNGSITVSNPMGGYGTYEYSIDGGSNWMTSTPPVVFSSLLPGTYDVRVRDAAQTACVAIHASTVVGITPHTGNDWYVDDDNAASSSNDALNTGMLNCPFKAIQVAVDAASNTNTIHVAAGTYAENVLVHKSVTIQGAGMGQTIVYPANFNATCGSEPCGTLYPGASNVFMVEIDNVTIQGLTVDGDAPSNGPGIDARNGITTNNAFNVNNLTVHHVEVKNIYLRGIYQYTQTPGGTYNFHDNVVSHVNSHDQSLGIFAYGGHGEIKDNVVSYCSSAINVNQPIYGDLTISGNQVSYSGQGVHVGNWNGGGIATVTNNNVTNGTTDSWGVSAFNLFAPISLTNNAVSGVTKGLVHAGSYVPAGVATFSGNEVNNSQVGFYQTTSLLGYGDVNVDSKLDNNIFLDCDTALALESTASGVTRTLMAHENHVTGYDIATKITANGPATDDLTCNFWDITDALALDAALTDGIIFLPFDNNGADADPGTKGYQPALNACEGLGPVVNVTNTPNRSYITIQAAIDNANTANGDVIEISSGTYAENVTVNKELTLEGANAGLFGCDNTRAAESLIAPAVGIPVTVTAHNVTINGFELTASSALAAISANGVSNLTVTNNNVHDVATTATGTQAAHAITYVVGNGSPSDLAITHNCISNVGNATREGTRGGIIVGENSSTGSLSGNVEIAHNRITNVSNDGSKGAYGILLGAGANGVVAAQVHHNEITGLTGLWAHAIGLEGNTPNAVVANNLIAMITASHTPENWAAGVKVESNSGAGSVAINNNSFDAGIIGINNATSGQPDASCNWYGSASANDVLARLNNITNYTNYLTSGADTDGGAIGFVPDATNCNGTPVVIVLDQVTNVTCAGGSDGAIDVGVSGGTSPDDLTFAWTGPNSFSSSDEDITGLAVGSYTLTVTDGNGSTDVLTVVVTEPALLTASVNIVPAVLCYGSDAVATFNGPNNGTVTYKVNGGADQSITLDGSGVATLALNALTVTTTVDLVSVSSTTPCSNSVTGSSSVVVDPLPVATITPTGSAICVNGSFTFDGADASTANGTYAWSHDGDGSLTDDNTLTPTYTPAGGDAGNTVTLTLTVTGINSCGSEQVTDTYALVVDPLPVATITAAPTTICVNSSFTFLGGDASSANGTVLWSHSGNGSLADANTLTPTYTPGVGDAGNTVTLTLTVTSNNSCGSEQATDTYALQVDELPVATITAAPTTICENSTFTFGVSDASSANGTVLWSHDGAGSLTDANTLTPTYTAAGGDAGNTVTLTLTVTSDNSCGAAQATDDYALQVDELPVAHAGTDDLDYCSFGTLVLNATPANIGTGVWTAVVNDAIIGAPTNPASSVTLNDDRAVTFRWTVTNGTCTAYDDVQFDGFVQGDDDCTDGNANTTNDTYNALDCACQGTPFVAVSAKAYLQGASAETMNPGDLMRDNLRTLTGPNGFPTVQPYNALPFSYGGTETIDDPTTVLNVSGNDAIVDWVLLELRSTSAPYSVLYRRAALLQRDGDIVDMNGTSPVEFLTVPTGSYRVSIRHRNHLGVMTNTNFALSGLPLAVDFTSIALYTNAAGANEPSVVSPAANLGGVKALWMGNANPLGSSSAGINNGGYDRLRYLGAHNDRDAILLKLGGSNVNANEAGYFNEDVNLDGVVLYIGADGPAGINDRDALLQQLDGFGVTLQRIQHLPQP